MDFLQKRKGRTVENVSEVEHTPSDESVRFDPGYRRSVPRDDEYFRLAVQEAVGLTKAER